MIEFMKSREENVYKTLKNCVKYGMNKGSILNGLMNVSVRTSRDINES